MNQKGFSSSTSILLSDGVVFLTASSSSSLEASFSFAGENSCTGLVDLQEISQETMGHEREHTLQSISFLQHSTFV